MRYDECPTIDESEWPALIAKFPKGPSHPHLGAVKNQGVEDACGCFAGASAIEFSRSVARLASVELDAFEMYGRVARPDGGTDFVDVLVEAMTTGYKPLGKITRVFHCPTFKHRMSAVLFGYPIVSIVSWYLNYVPNYTGWLPVGKGTASTHEIMGYKPTVRNTPQGNREYGIWHRQSRGKTWAPSFNNSCVLSESQSMGEPGSSDAFAIVSIQDEGRRKDAQQ